MGRFTRNELIAEMRATAMREDKPLKSLLLRKATEEEQAGPGLHGPESELHKAIADDDSFRRRSHSETKAGDQLLPEKFRRCDRYVPLLQSAHRRYVHPTSTLDCGA